MGLRQLGGTSIGIANYVSPSADAKELPGDLYAAAKKPVRTVIDGQVCILKVRVFDSFGEDAFAHVHLSIALRSDSRTQVDEILEGTLDLAVVADELVQSDKLIVSCLGSEEILIFKSPDYEFISSEFFRWEDVAAARVLLADKNCAFRLLFDRAPGVVRFLWQTPWNWEPLRRPSNARLPAWDWRSCPGWP